MILPGSFRHHLARTLTHERTVDANERFARIPRRFQPQDHLGGVFFHADSARPGHFGHVMTEVVARLWAWSEAKAASPQVQAIYRLSPFPERSGLDRRVLEAFGIAASDIVAVDRPVQLDTVYSATAMWHNPHPRYVHAEMTKLWAQLARHLVTTAPAEPFRRIFVSRPPALKVRPCTNTTEVEEFFGARGFTVVYPERHDLAEQASIFAGAEVVAGFAGSALVNVQFCRDLKSLIVLGHQAYTARNEYLMASLLGCELHYFWSRADVSHPTAGWSQEAFRSSWRFDLEQHQRDLDRIVGP